MRQTIAFGIFADDAEILKRVAVKRLEKLAGPNDVGGAMFEITEIKTELSE
jgi:hypothetical protein